MCAAIAVATFHGRETRRARRLPRSRYGHSASPPAEAWKPTGPDAVQAGAAGGAASHGRTSRRQDRDRYRSDFGIGQATDGPRSFMTAVDQLSPALLTDAGHGRVGRQSLQEETIDPIIVADGELPQGLSSPLSCRFMTTRRSPMNAIPFSIASANSAISSTFRGLLLLPIQAGPGRTRGNRVPAREPAAPCGGSISPSHAPAPLAACGMALGCAKPGKDLGAVHQNAAVTPDGGQSCSEAG